MAILSKDELIKKVSTYIGDKTDDDSISLLEDLTDTLNEDGEDWKKKYEENDSNWRKRYRERFENGNQVRKDEVEDNLKKAETNENTAAMDETDTEKDRKELEEAVFEEDEKRKEGK